jgi:histidinol dehydrogenase
MKIFLNPLEATWPQLIRRPQLELEFLESNVRNTLNRVRLSGDSALRELTLKYDSAAIDRLDVTVQEMESATLGLDKSLKRAIEVAASNIKKFHAAQKRESIVVETMPGVNCWRKSIPIQRIGIYIPGGTAPLFSTVLMLAIPAQLAGCREIVLCTPPNKDGYVNAAILFAASLSGITKIYKVGGAQAIAAMAYGTESIPAVYKIFGPGNQYVTKAKQMVNQEGVAIDLPAGPSEVLVLIDSTADAPYVAADLLSQAEHGTDSQVVLVSLAEAKVQEVQENLALQLKNLPRKSIAEQSLQKSLALHFSDEDMALRFVNEYAAEHVIIQTMNADVMADKIINAGSVFIGPYSPEAVGDYASGTNHTLPTAGFAKAYSGVSLESFTKSITYQKLSKEGLTLLGPSVEVMAAAEQLIGHQQAVTIRLKNLK